MVRMDEEASKEHDSTNGEVTLDYWQVEIPLDPSRMVRAADLSSVFRLWRRSDVSRARGLWW